MPLEMVQIQPAAQAVAERTLARVLASVRAPLRFPAGVQPTLEHAHPVYEISLDELTRIDAPGPRLVSWRFLVMSGAQPVGALEMAPDATDPVNDFRRLATQDPHAEATLAAQETAERLGPVMEGAYDLCLLRIPELDIVVLWCRDRNGTRDLALPLDPTHRCLTPYRLYAYDEALRLVAGEARARLGHDAPAYAT